MTTTPMSPAVDRLLQLAVAAGLAVSTTVKPYAGVREIRLESRQPDGAFGAIRVGVRSGRVLGGGVVYPDGAHRRNRVGYREMHTALAGLPLAPRQVVDYHGSLTGEHGRKVVIGTARGGYLLADRDNSWSTLSGVRRESITATGLTAPPDPDWARGVA